MPRVVYSTGFLTEANKTNISPTVITLVEISPAFAPGTVDAFATFSLPAPQNYNNLLRTVSSIDCDIVSGIGRVSIAITNADLSRVADESKGYYQGYECKVHKVLRLDNGNVIGILLLYGIVTSYSMDEKTLNLEVITRINAANSISNRDCGQKCPWVFKGTECGYVGALTTCNKVYNSADGCSGRSNQHRFGGFPGRDSIAALGVVSGQGTTPNFQFSLPSSTIVATTSITIAAPDISYVECRHTAPITITLPDPSVTSLKKQTITIKDASVSGAATNNITIQAATGTTINGASSFVLNANKQAISLTPSDDALDWRIVSGYATGNVSSVALTAPSILNVSGSPITSSGTINLTLATQNANTVFAGPTTGSAAAPTFRSLVVGDIPDLSSIYQTLDSDLTAIAALTANGLLRKTAGTWAMDSASYLTANQTITLSGDVTGSGATSIATTIANAAVTFAKMQSIASGRLLGRTTAGSGPIQEITPGTGILTWLQTPTGTNLYSAISSGKTGLGGDLVFSWEPIFLGLTTDFINGVATIDGGQTTGTQGRQIKFIGVTGGSHNIQISNASATSGPKIDVDSGSANIGLIVGSKGTGELQLFGGNVSVYNNTSTSGGQLRLRYSSSSASSGVIRFYGSATNFISLRSPSTLTADTAYVLPASDGTLSQVLTTDGAGNLSWTTVTGVGTVTSVTVDIGTTGSGLLTSSGSPITSSGTISLGLTNQSQNTVLAGPITGTATTPSFRALVVGDIPDLSSIYQPLDSDLTAIAALTANGLLRKTAGVWAMDSASYLTANQTITLSGDMTGSGSTSITATIANDAVTYAKIQNVSAASRLLGRGSASGGGDVEEIAIGTGLSMSGTTLSATAVGSVTSVGLSAPSIFTVTNSPVTSTGTLTLTLAAQTANTIFAGPATGSAADPTFRLMIMSDLPNQTGDRTGTGSLVFATSPTIITPRISAIHAASSPNNAVLSFAQVASSVNYIQISNSATGFDPIIEPIGTDSAIGLIIKSKSSASVVIQSGGLDISPIDTSLPGTITIQGGASSGTGGTLIFNNPGNASSIGFAAPDTISSTTIFTLPSGDGTNGQALRTNGSGVLSWGTFLTSNQTITLSGDVTGSGSTSIATTIANDAVTFAKMQNISSSRLIGRVISSGFDTGDPQQIGLGTGLQFNFNSTLSTLSVNSSDIISIIQGSGIIPPAGVTSVGLSAPSIFTVTNSPVTSTGTLTLTLATQVPNTIFAGPASGSAAQPTFRAMVTEDIPNNAVTTAKIGDDQVTYAKMQNVSAASRLLGRGSTAGTLEVEELTVGTGLSISGTTVSRTYTQPTIKVYTSSGNWFRPAGCRFVKVKVWGAGGGGGGTGVANTFVGFPTTGYEFSLGAGGGGGGYAEKIVDVTSISTSTPVTVTIGAGGTGGTGNATPNSTGGTGGTGGTTSFGTYVSASGGAGGTGGKSTPSSGLSNSSGGGPGNGSNGDVNIEGQRGINPICLVSYIWNNVALTNDSGYGLIFGLSGAGGPGANGGGGGASQFFPTTSGNGNAPGGGGGGAHSGSANTVERAGGAGAAGRCVIEEYYD